MPTTPTILVFDSGLGGLTVLAEIVQRLPHASCVYVADDAAFPYGSLPQDKLIKRLLDVIGKAILLFNPDVVVIACNTASTIGLPSLRASYPVPFVGTVPAVKPTALASVSRTISILGTPGTVSREYTHDLIIAHAADCRVTLVGAQNLATMAEARLRGEAISDSAVLAEILPCFKERDGVKTDAIALACTHYPLLLDVYRRVAPWDVIWIDPAPAIARQVEVVLRRNGDAANSQIMRAQAMPSRQTGTACFTSGDTPSGSMKAMLESRHLTAKPLFRLPFQRLCG
jgi:glutamate racemase